ncbi:aminodeoxychorismate synthase component I [Halofilum ochraceum]|uniref:aminodeoxychorismate synthase component I n=1 Tax=Halofilum ochraceum TaxID=1611323 RepID=UPI00083555E0|nr:aminodeoxychorismate synthase component I [Halofilum ochraceum]
MNAAQRFVELPYRPDPAAAFECIVDEPWPVLLDSGAHGGARARFDILAADPSVTLETRGGETRLVRRDGSIMDSPADPFALVRAELGAVEYRPPDGLPFAGGAIGWFAYDLARRLEQLPARAIDAEQIPEMAVGIYDWAFVTDHVEQRSWMVAAGRDTRTAERWSELESAFRAPGVPVDRGRLRVQGAARANLDEAAYREAFARVQRYLRAGDCYQVNLAQRFEVAASGPSWPAFRQLRHAARAPFAAYMSTPAADILSVSPERFLQVGADGRVETRPIKGTRPRDSDPARDRELGESLVASAKDRAENVMIVDLLRNDLGRVCATGSVRVPRLFELESFPGVHHLVSTVTGRLAPERHALDLLRASFPGGSITGAPKIRAMEIIEELEPHRRGVYCGAIGYIGFDGAMDTNIAIRTLVYSDGRVRCWAGGGLVIDSEAAAEYQETFDKAAGMLRLLREAAD